MKVSLKFPDDQRPPLLRAKIPISILGIHFLAGAGASERHDVRLDLTTAFESGPAFRVSYRPNHPSIPFSLSIKTGIGPFGSPVAAPMSMITEFNLSSRSSSSSPAFSVIFKPRLGDFCLRKTVSSPLSSPAPSRKINPVENEMFPPSPSPIPAANGIHAGGKVNGVSVDFPSAPGGNGISTLISSVEATARSVLPIHNRAELRFQWSFRMPKELWSSFPTDAFSVANLPVLVMNKISIALIPSASRAKHIEKRGDIISPCEVTEPCKSVRLDLAGLQAESKALRKSVEDIHQIIYGISEARKALPALGNKDSIDSDAGKGGWRAAVPQPAKRDRRSEVKSAPEDVNEEFKKALMSAQVAEK